MSVVDKRIVFDACCGICLYASGYMRTVLQSLPKAVIADYVYQIEMKAIYNPQEAINLEELINEGMIEIHMLQNEMEAQTSVNLAYYMEDGEADSGALAIHRQWVLATDEKKVIAHLQLNYPHIQVITTPEILKHWADSTQLLAPEVAIAIRNIEVRARYVIPHEHSLNEWWQYCKTVREVE